MTNIKVSDMGFDARLTFNGLRFSDYSLDDQAQIVEELAQAAETGKLIGKFVHTVDDAYHDIRPAAAVKIMAAIMRSSRCKHCGKQAI